MAAINLEISFFTENDGNVMSIESKINESIRMIVNENDYIVIDNTYCYNELELRTLLQERGILN